MDAFFFLLAIVLLVFLLANRHKAKKARNQFMADAKNAEAARSELAGKVEKLRIANIALASENQALSAFKDILDAKREAERILQVAQGESEEIKRRSEHARLAAEEEIKQLIAGANTQSQSELAEARDEAKRIRAQSKANGENAARKAASIMESATQHAASVMESANREARTIVENATKRGEEIAGSAFEVVQDAERFERVAKAMKNLIEGYGDRYVIPSRSLLDDLASDYGFTEAGEELRNARERSIQMVKNQTAATCDYVEKNRRDTAITFVVDAFNGKVDSILSRAKEDNVGTLEQEIRDSFNLVNHNGTAFRNARIEPSYLEARLTELRWAATTFEIKLRDKEEQRRIKEQIREEEKAQRDFERAMRDAAKEEDLLRKAMERIQTQVDKASAEQRGKYEAQLAEMAGKLLDAEERSKRALSMAQQTRMGHVYVISNIGSFGEDVYKIGLTRRLDPLDRVNELGNASVPFSFDVHAMIASDDAPSLETKLHQHFLTAQVNKVNQKKEFFRVPIKTIREEIEALGIATKWTLAAEARQFRETLAIEKEIRENPDRGRQWMESQVDIEASPSLDEEEVPV